jgi:hypothetical protein
LNSRGFVKNKFLKLYSTKLGIITVQNYKAYTNYETTVIKTKYLDEIHIFIKENKKDPPTFLRVDNWLPQFAKVL